MPDVLYRSVDGSWRQGRARPGSPRVYRLKTGERWTLLDDDRVLIVHPDKAAKVVYPDGRVEEITGAVGTEFATGTGG